MNADVARLKHKLNSKKFGTVHPRQPRDHTALQEVIDKDILKYVPPLDGHVYGAVPEEPKAGYVKVSENNVEDLLPHFNQLLLYRILRLLYGAPDILSAYASQSDGTASRVDWGYSFSVQPDLVGEIRNKFTSRVYLSYWGPKGAVTPETLKQRQQGMASCLDELRETVEKNLHLWNEREELKDLEGHVSLVNVPAEKYRGGELLLTRARESDHRPARKAFEYGESPPLQSVGHLYLSAATMFFVSFESFVNLLYRLLLRKEFRSDTYARLTVRSDLDLRLLSLHVFCRGFHAQAVEPDSPLYGQLLQLRDFRNDVVHGNITEEHECHSLEEDGFMFFYLPAGDYRGRKKEESIPKGFSRFQSNIGEDTVTRTKETVDALREAILAAMEPETRAWVLSWLWRPIVPTGHPNGP
jgi:hypothetical protein